MEVTKQQKIAVLKSIQEDLLKSFGLAKATETGVVAEKRLRIEAAKTNLQRLHADCDMLLKYYANVAK
jgi:hypothetical protein